MIGGFAFSIYNESSEIYNQAPYWDRMKLQKILIFIHHIVSQFHRKICKLKAIMANKRWNVVIAGGAYLHFYVCVQSISTEAML